MSELIKWAISFGITVGMVVAVILLSVWASNTLVGKIVVLGIPTFLLFSMIPWAIKNYLWDD